MEKIKTVAIVGLGVVGGSIAKALKHQNRENFYVTGIDSDPITLKKALASGVIQEGESYNKTILQRADLVFISLYPSEILNFLKENRDQFKQGAILTDVTGIKGSIIQQVMNVLPPQVDFIFGHPMAGKENKGFDYASGEVFQGANYLIIPTEANDEQHLKQFEEFVRLMGFTRVTRISADTHDAMIAYTSQLCHVIAVALINSDDRKEETIDFVGDSYRELTRIANINSELWSQLFLGNKQALLHSITLFEEQIRLLRQAISAEDRESLTSYLREATQRRKQLEYRDDKLNNN